MHSYWHRLNTVFTFFGTVAAVLCVLTTSTDLFHKSTPIVNVSIAEIRRLTPYLGQKDQAVLTFNLEADLRSVFSWNTKQLFVFVQAEYTTPQNKENQVVIWDYIVQSKAGANIRLKHHKTKYPLIDQGKNFRGTPVNFTVVWNVMPRVGYLYTQSQTFSMGSFPAEYKM